MAKPFAFPASLLLILDAACVHAAAPARQNQPATDAPAEGPGIALDRNIIIGIWTDDGNCGPDAPIIIEFSQDGRFVVPNGAFGRWKLDDDRLTMTGRSAATVRIVPIDRDTITVVHEDGSLGRSTRC